MGSTRCKTSRNVPSHCPVLLPNFIPRGSLALPDFPGLFLKFQNSLRAVETILRAKLLQKVNILQQRTVVLLLWRTSIKNLEKRKIKSQTFASWKYWKDSRIVRQKIWTKNGAGSDRILGNDKRVVVAVFTNRKIKTTKSKTRQSDPESLSEKATSY